MSGTIATGNGVTSTTRMADVPPNRGWRAWWAPGRAAGREAGAGGPLQLHVAGEVLVPHEGIEPFLTERDLRAPERRRLRLELHLRRLPGDWPPFTTWRLARYTRPLATHGVELAEVRFDFTLVAAVEVESGGRPFW
jgi:hypothetical protein